MGTNRISDNRSGTRNTSDAGKVKFLWRDDPVASLRAPWVGSNILRVKKKDIIFHQATPSDAVFYLLKGRVKLTALSPEGREATIALLQEGDFLGEESLDGKQRLRTTTAIALSECTVLKAERKAMLQMLQRDPELFNFFLSFIISRNVRMQEDLVDRLFYNSEQRLARFLVLLAGLDHSEEMEVVVPKVSQEILAEMVGATRSRVSLFMNRFRKMGFIDYDGDYTGELRVRRTIKEVLAKR